MDEKLQVGDLVEILPPFIVYEGSGRIATFINDIEHLNYIKTRNYRLIVKRR